MEHHFETTGPVAAYVQLGAGTVRVHAEDTGQAQVTVSGPRADEFDVQLSGRQLTVVAPKGRFFSGSDLHDVEVVVPTGSDLATRLGSAGLETTGPLGQLRLKTGSGDVEVDAAGGHAVIESGSGDVRCHRLEAEVRIKSGSGDIELGEVHGKLGASTGSGDVVLDHGHDTVVVKTGSGDLTVNRSEGDVSLHTASGDLTVGRAASGSIVVKSASGDVRIAIPAGTPVWTDINTVSGRVASNLESAGEPAEGQPYLEVRANTVSGDVHLARA